jgi:hypothetical protein
MLGGCEYGQKGIRPRKQALHSGERDRISLDQELKPQDSLIDFFNNDSYFGNKLGLRACTANGSVVGRNGGTATQQLPSKDTGHVTPGQRLKQSDNSDGKLLAPLFEFFCLIGGLLHPSMSQWANESMDQFPGSCCQFSVRNASMGSSFAALLAG